MTFIISLILIWIISIIILIVDFKSECNRWISSAAFFVGLRYLADSINVLAAPNEKNYIKLIICILTSISFVFYPYTLLMFSLRLTKILEPKYNKFLMWILLVPIALVYIFLPIKDFMYPTIKPSYKYLTLWSTFGIFLSNILLIVGYFKTASIQKKKNIFLVGVFMIPTTIFGWLINFFLPVIGIRNLWKFNIIVVFVVVALYCLLVAKYGFLGIKIKFEKKDKQCYNTIK